MEKAMVAYKSLPAPPWYWEIRAATVAASDYNLVDISRSSDDEALPSRVNLTCNAATLGQGRDQVVPMKYSRLKVASLHRIESGALWQKYQAAKRHMLAVHGKRATAVKAATWCDWMAKNDLQSAANECYLWHGTKPDIKYIIKLTGMDERVCSFSGLFGAGVYFADMYSKSDQYTTPDRNGRYYLILCRVALGIAYSTSHGMQQARRAPQPHAGPPPTLFDSVVGKTGAAKYTEYIVYDRAQCYPEFLVAYERK